MISLKNFILHGIFVRFLLTKILFYTIFAHVTNSNAVVVEFGRHASLRC